ncbi:hypothetical protein RJT34_29943 [Clitoria ternatea]|uniref:Uncharacterized protein n=1 Tax=Clitoria ternatea TaxID=43366 RepID=A0AAN9HZY2_CLITE
MHGPSSDLFSRVMPVISDVSVILIFITIIDRHAALAVITNEEEQEDMSTFCCRYSDLHLQGKAYSFAPYNVFKLLELSRDWLKQRMKGLVIIRTKS